MRKVLKFFACLSFFLVLVISNIDAHSFEIDDMRNTLEIFEDLDESYKVENIDDFSEAIWKEHGLLVLKKMAKAGKIVHNSIIEKGKRETADNEKYGYPWRYLGLTPEEYLVENPDFPVAINFNKTLTKLHK